MRREKVRERHIYRKRERVRERWGLGVEGWRLGERVCVEQRGVTREGENERAREVSTEIERKRSR